MSTPVQPMVMPSSTPGPADARVIKYTLECLNGGQMDWDDLAILVGDDFRKCGEPLGIRQWERCLESMITSGLVDEIEHPKWCDFLLIKAIPQTAEAVDQPCLF